MLAVAGSNRSQAERKNRLGKHCVNRAGNFGCDCEKGTLWLYFGRQDVLYKRQVSSVFSVFIQYVTTVLLADIGPRLDVQLIVTFPDLVTDAHAVHHSNKYAIRKVTQGHYVKRGGGPH